MTKLIIYNDIHCGNPHEAMSFNALRQSIEVDTTNGEKVYLLGDIIDMKNCKKSDVGYYMAAMTSLLTKPELPYLLGNHEAMGSAGARFIKVGNIIMAHGDFEAWGEERALKFRNSPHGAGPLKRMMVAAIDEARLLMEAQMSDFFINNCLKLMRDNGCDTYICGHKHPKTRLVHEANGMKIIVLPKGRNEDLI